MIGGTDPNDGVALTEAVAAINSAIGKLQRLGQSDKAIALIEQVEQTTAYTQLDADTTHNQDYLRTQYARTYIGVMADLARRLGIAANQAGGQDQDDAARVYGIKGLSGDVASLSISRRDAGDRIDATDPARLRDLLATAVRNGDEVLAHAVAEAAIKNGDTDTATDFQTAYPDLAGAVERLWTAEHRKMNTVDVKVAWSITALKPAALSSLPDFEIELAAAGKANVGSWSVG